MVHHTRSYFVSICLATLLCAFIPGAMHAQSNAAKTDALTKDADLIVVGKVGRVDCAWADGKKRIETRVSVSVDETIKGNAEGNTVMVVVPGGEIDGVGEWYSHTPRFGQDENIVLFAKKDSGGKYRVAGGEHGKVSVVKDSRSGKKIVPNAGTLEEFTTAVKKSVSDNDHVTKQKE